jgi:hypothetical protein
VIGLECFWLPKELIASIVLRVVHFIISYIFFPPSSSYCGFSLIKQYFGLIKEKKYYLAQEIKEDE